MIGEFTGGPRGRSAEVGRPGGGFGRGGGEADGDGATGLGGGGGWLGQIGAGGRQKCRHEARVGEGGKKEVARGGEAWSSNETLACHG